LAETKRTDLMQALLSLSASTTGSSAYAQLKLSLLIPHISCRILQIPKRLHNDIQASLRSDITILFLSIYLWSLILFQRASFPSITIPPIIFAHETTSLKMPSPLSAAPGFQCSRPGRPHLVCWLCACGSSGSRRADRALLGVLRRRRGVL
jgi:hypothetical protein